MPNDGGCAAPGCAPTTPSWVNYGGNQKVYPRCLVRPRTIAELRDIICEVGARGGRLRAVATGLSFSDILQTDDTLVVLTDLQSNTEPGALLPLEEELWRVPVVSEPRVRVVAGARIRELNAALARAGLAFENLGGYDGQTFIGAFSTSTHGSGIRLGPLPSAVRSMDLVGAGGALLRIERTNGITDPDKFRRRYGSSMTLCQNDAWFRACVVSLGCMGVISSAVVAVRSSYRLHEHKRVAAWSKVKEELRAFKTLDAFRHYEVLVNPYPRRDRDYSCLVTERSIAPPDAARIPFPASQQNEEDVLFLPTTQEGIVRLMNGYPRVVPDILQFAFDGLQTSADEIIDDSYVVFNIGKVNSAKVLSGEYFVPLEGELFITATERLINLIATNRARGVYQTSPISLRFVQGSDAYLSMANGARPQCAIEMSIFTEARGALEAILSYEEALMSLGARPHWGQFHGLTGARGWLDRAYPEAGSWRSVFYQLNAHGIFDNAFTDRLALSVKPRSAACAR